MNKLMKILSVLLTTTLVMFVFTCCSLSAASKLSGRWERENTEEIYAEFDVLEFFSDGKYTSDDVNYSGSYSIEDNRIRMSGILVETLTFTFEVSGNKLTLINDDGDEWIYIKKQ